MASTKVERSAKERFVRTGRSLVKVFPGGRLFSSQQQSKSKSIESKSKSRYEKISESLRFIDQTFTDIFAQLNNQLSGKKYSSFALSNFTPKEVEILKKLFSDYNEPLIIEGLSAKIEALNTKGSSYKKVLFAGNEIASISGILSENGQYKLKAKLLLYSKQAQIGCASTALIRYRQVIEEIKEVSFDEKLASLQARISGLIEALIDSIAALVRPDAGELSSTGKSNSSFTGMTRTGLLFLLRSIVLYGKEGKDREDVTSKLLNADELSKADNYSKELINRIRYLEAYIKQSQPEFSLLPAPAAEQVVATPAPGK